MVLVSGDIKEQSSKFETFDFFSANEVKDGTDNTLPTLIYKDAIITIHQVNEIIDYIIFIINTFLLPHVEDVESIRAQYKAQDLKLDQ